MPQPGTFAELESEIAHLESALVDGEGASADGSMPGLAASTSKRTQADEEPLTLTSGNQAISFLASDMMYAESLKRVRIIHLANGESFRVNLALAQLIEMLPSDRFAYCHRSIVVNLDYVREMGTEALALENGTTIPVGRRRVSELRQALSDRRGTTENARL